MKTRTLVVDIETAPTLAYVWRSFKENIGLKQIVENPYIMSFSAKWLDEDDIIYMENRHGDDREVVSALFNLFDEADLVVAHNAKKFDIPTIRGRGLVLGLKPYSPIKIVDTLLIAKGEFRLFQNNLAYIAKLLGCEAKEEHKEFPGFELWLQCLKQNDAAWEEMKVYNIQDVLTLEEVYLRMRPYASKHPNVAVKEESAQPLCPKCGSHHIHFRGYYNTNVGKYRKFQCQGCGGWGRTRHTEYPKDVKKELMTNAV